MDPIETIHAHGCKIKIYQDDSAENPIQEFDCEPHVSVWHRSYDFGNYRDFGTPDDFRDYCGEQEKAGDPVVKIPLYLLDHSGLSASTGPFACDPGGWDSGQVGWVWITRGEARDQWGVETDEGIDQNLRGCVTLLDQYLTGQVYGYCCEDAEGNEIDSCWGFFGDPKDSGLLEQATDAAQDHEEKLHARAAESMSYAI
jgi:hypothetical protein